MTLKNVKYVVLVLSGKGGVGKSSITTQLALSLTLQGHNVGILDVDLTGPSIPRLLGIETSKVKQAAGGWMPVPVHDAQILPPSPLQEAEFTEADRSHSLQLDQSSASTFSALTLDNSSNRGDHSNTPGQASPPPQSTTKRIGWLRAMSLAFLLSSRSTAIVWRGPKKTAMIRQFLSDTDWPEGTDYLLVDTPPGTSDEHISLVETLLKEINGGVGEPASSHPANSPGPKLAGAVIVTTPQAVAVSDVRKELNFCSKTGVKVLGVVENMSGYVCPCCGEAANLFSKGGGQVMATEFKVPFLGSIPVDPLWGVLVEEGKRPRYNEESAAAAASNAEDEDEVDANSSTQESMPRAKEDGLLVDKYRDCSLAPSFRDIAAKVVERSVEGTAVAIGRM